MERFKILHLFNKALNAVRVSGTAYVRDNYNESYSFSRHPKCTYDIQIASFVRIFRIWLVVYKVRSTTVSLDSGK